MDWMLFIVFAHLMIGLFCGHLACGARLKVEPWFLAGTLLGGLALLAFLLFARRKRPLSGYRKFTVRKA